MDDAGKKVAGGVLAGLGAIGTAMVGMVDDCGRVAARGARVGDDVVVSGAHYGDDLAGTGRYGAYGDDLAGTGRYGDELGGAYGGGIRPRRFGLPAADAPRAGALAAIGEGGESSARAASLTDDALESAAGLTFDLGAEAISFSFDVDDGSETATRDLAGGSLVRVLALAQEPVGADRSVGSLAALDDALVEAPPGGPMVLVLPALAHDPRRIAGTPHERAPSVIAVLTRCAQLERDCVLVVCEGEDTPHARACAEDAVRIARIAAAAGAYGLDARLLAARDRSPSRHRIALHRAQREGSRLRHAQSPPEPR